MYIILFICNESPQSIGEILLWNGSTNGSKKVHENSVWISWIGKKPLTARMAICVETTFGNTEKSLHFSSY